MSPVKRDPNETREDALREVMEESMRRDPPPQHERNVMTPPDADRQVADAMTKRDIAELHTQLDALKKQVDAMAAERDKALRWGVLSLGSALVLLGSWVFNLITGHMK